MFCREQVARYIDAKDTIEGFGFRLVIVGNGTPDHLRDFKQRYPEATAIFTDPSRASYRALELRHGVGSLMSLGMISNGMRAVRAGHTQGATAGDPLQQGGVAVFDTNGTQQFIHRDTTAGDSLPAEDLVGVLRRLSHAAS